MIGAQIQIRLALRDVPVKVFLPCPIARHAGRLRTLALDQERISVGIVVEPALDIEPLLELRAGLRLVDARRRGR